MLLRVKVVTSDFKKFYVTMLKGNAEISTSCVSI